MPQATRQDMLNTGCPKCKALPGSPCIGSRGDRKAFHMERIETARKKFAPYRKKRK